MAKKLSNKELHWLDTGIFPATVMFSCGFSFDEIIEILKEKKATDWLTGLDNDKQLIETGNYFGLRRDLEDTKTGKRTTLFYLILKPRFAFTDEQYCILAHEILHICQFLLPDVLDRNKEIEAEAYLHTHLMSNILKILRAKD